MRRLLFGALLVTLITGCRTPVVPLLVAGPFAPGDARVFDAALMVAARRGYTAQDVDAGEGTFFVSAHNDPAHRVTFDVQCVSEGWIVVTPRGEVVVPTDRGFPMRQRLADEYAAFVAALDREVHPPEGRSSGGLWAPGEDR